MVVTSPSPKKAPLMRIMTTHDVFRSAYFHLPDPELSIGPWFFQWLAPHLTQLGHRVTRFSLTDSGRPDALIVAAGHHALPREASSWAWLFSDPRGLPAASGLCAPLLEADLIIGFEMPPNMIRFLAAAGKRFFDLGQDPLRFCPDLFLRIRGGDTGLEDRLTGWMVANETVSRDALTLCNRLGTTGGTARGVLFAGQMPVDSSLIAGAAIANVAPFLDRIEELLDGRPLLLKPHPLSPKSQDLITLHRRFPASRYIDDNIYAMLAQPDIETIVTLSSSVAAEAAYFVKPAVSLITPDIIALPEDVVSRFHRVDRRVTTTAFWGALLDDMPAFMFVEDPPALLRTRFSVSWGFTRDMAEVTPRGLTDNETILFSDVGRGPDLCLFGFSTPEPWGVWTAGEIAVIQFTPPENLETFVAELTLMPHVPDPAHPLLVTIDARTSDGQTSGSFRFDSHAAREIDIAMTWAADSGPVEIVFHIDNPVSPHAAGGSDDTRLLGLGLHQLKLRWA